MEKTTNKAVGTVKKASSKLMGIGLLGVLVLGVIGAFLLTRGGEISKNDLQNSIDKLAEVVKINDEEPTSNLETIEGANEAQKEFSDIVDRWEVANDELSDTKGIEHEDVEEAYKAYEAASEAELGLGKDLIESVPAIGVTSECGSVLQDIGSESNVEAEIRQAISSCKQNIADLGESPLPEYQALVSETDNLMDDLLSFLDTQDDAALDTEIDNYLDATLSAGEESDSQQISDDYDDAAEDLKDALEKALAEA